MTRKKSVALFPYSSRLLPIIRHFNDFQQQYIIESVLAWEGAGLHGKDVAFVCNQPPVGVKVSTIDTNLEPAWQTLLVNCCDISNQFSLFNIKEYFLAHLASKREIIFVGVCRENSLDCISLLCQEHPTNTRQLSSNGDIAFSFITPQFTPICTPIILVGGLVSRDDTLEVILSLRKKFCADGHVVSCITSNDMGLLLGMHSFNSIFDNSNLSEDEKILHLNRMAHSVIIAERPEILIVETPDTIMKFADIAPNGFGIRTSMLNLALSPDMFICCMPFDFATRDYVKNIYENFMEKFGIPLVGVHATNAVVDFTDVSQTHQMSIVYADMALIDSMVIEESRNCTVPIFNILLNGSTGIYQYIQSFFEKD